MKSDTRLITLFRGALPRMIASGTLFQQLKKSIHPKVTVSPKSIDTLTFSHKFNSMR